MSSSCMLHSVTHVSRHQQGLLDEIRSLRSQLPDHAAVAGRATLTRGPSGDDETENEPIETDYTLGVYQSIGEQSVIHTWRRLNQCLGFKEFHEYLSTPLHDDTVFQEALQKMKTATRRYTNRQNMWIRNQLLPAARAANTANHLEGGCDIVPTYVLDATGESCSVICL